MCFENAMFIDFQRLRWLSLSLFIISFDRFIQGPAAHINYAAMLAILAVTCHTQLVNVPIAHFQLASSLNSYPNLIFIVLPVKATHFKFVQNVRFQR